MATYTIGSSGADYTTLAAGIAAAGVGDTLSILSNFVHDGTTVTVNVEDLTIESASGLSPQISSALIRTIDVYQDGVTLRNLWFYNTYDGARSVVYLGFNQNVTVEKCRIENDPAVAGYLLEGMTTGCLVYKCHFIE